MPSNLHIVTTSTTRGTFVMTHSPPPRIVEARIGKAEFLAPPILTSPRRGIPPEMTILSIVVFALPCPLSNDHTIDAGVVLYDVDRSVSRIGTKQCLDLSTLSQS